MTLNTTEVSKMDDEVSEAKLGTNYSTKLVILLQSTRLQAKMRRGRSR